MGGKYNMVSLCQLVQAHLHHGTCGFKPVTRLGEWSRGFSFAGDALVQCTTCTTVHSGSEERCVPEPGKLSFVTDIILRSPFYYP